MKIGNTGLQSFGLVLAILMVPGLALAETHVVKMVSTDPNDPSVAMDFVPSFLHIQKGDSVVFEPVQAGHNTASKRGMLPEGAQSWNTGLDKSFEMKFEQDGTYGYVCTPHYSVGMVGLILVGDYKVNLDVARKVRHRGKAKRAFKALFEKVDALQ